LKYCKNCGHQIKEGALFCPECGQPVKSTNERKQNDSKPVTPQNKQNYQQSRSGNKPKRPLFSSKKSKIITIIAAVLAVVLIGGYFTIDRMLMSPSVVTESFVTAVQEKDIAKVKAHINEGQLEMEASNEDVKAFVEYLNEYPRLITEISDQLELDAQAFESGSNHGIAADSEALASLKLEGKKWLLFDHYVVQVRPVYMDIATTEDESKIFLNDKEAGKVNSDKAEKLGPFLPGQYEVKAVINGEYGDIEQSKQVNFFESEEMEEMEAVLEFNFSDNYLPVYSDNEDATVFVNGKSTKKKVKDFSTFGPVPLDGSVEIYAEKEFATSVHKSDTTIVDENTYDIDLYLDYTDYDEEYDLERAKQEELEKLEGEAADVVDTVYAHYGNISNDNFEDAYNLFSSNMQGKFGLDGWAEGLEANILDDVTSVEVTSVDGNSAHAYIEMTSYDEQDDGSILVQEWEGEWSLVKENGSWKMDSTELEKVDSWTEG